MIIVQASHIYKSFGEIKILEDISLAVREGERVGLVGRNGAGKTTLLKIMTRELLPDAGEVIKAKNILIGYLAQNGGLQSDLTVWEEMRTVFTSLIQQEKQLRELEIKMGLDEVTNNPGLLKQITEEYTNLREIFSRAGGYEYEANMRSILHGLKFSLKYLNVPVSRLSGGEKTRLALAKLLLMKPPLLILDEPTNYLDMDTMSWLEKYLQNYSGAILTVSHDRYFLDALTNTIYELEYGKVKRYNGNYSKYLALKAEDLERQAKQYRKQQEEIAHLQNFVQRNIARASTTGRAKSKQKLLEKIKPLEKPISDDKNINLSIQAGRQSGKEVLEVKDLNVGYKGRPIVSNINFNIYRDERVAILGPNGTGKTTLLKTIGKIIPPISGSIRLGYHVTLDYYEQEQQNLSGNKLVLYELWDSYPDLNEQTVRSILGRFLFSGENVYKNISDLSGGEKSRVALAKLICSQANFLLLDEPTSHLDILSNEAMEDALIEYPGTLLFVSHDRYFINKIATRIIELTPEGVNNYQGNFDYYQRKKAEQAEKDLSAKETTVTDAKKDYLFRKELQRKVRKKQRRAQELEQIINATEKEIAQLEQELYQPEVYNEHEVYNEKSSALERLRAELENYMEEWLLLSEEISNS